MCEILPYPVKSIRVVIYCCACWQTTGPNANGPPQLRAEQFFSDTNLLLIDCGPRRFPESPKSRCTNRFCTHSTTELPESESRLNSTNQLEQVSHRVWRRRSPRHGRKRIEVECLKCDEHACMEALVWVCWACETKNLLIAHYYRRADPTECIKCSYPWDTACRVGYWTVPWKYVANAGIVYTFEAMRDVQEGWFVEDSVPEDFRVALRNKRKEDGRC